jgi:RNA polymerase sigma factor (sigma-70 family)
VVAGTVFSAPPEQQGITSSGTEDRAVLRAALAMLPPGQRAVVVLRFLRDLSIEEVSELLGCSSGTVKSQTAHALAKLRHSLAKRELAMTVKGN